MRIGTRTLKVTAWLSAAIFTASLSCYACNLCGIAAGSTYKHHNIFIVFGNFSYSYADESQMRADRGWTSPVWIYTLDQPASFVLIEQWPSVEPSWVKMPLWIPAIISLAVGMPAFVTLRRRARTLKNGACLKCGYVLTGLPLAAPCPECGRVTR